jgi:hypothetical protein
VTVTAPLGFTLVGEVDASGVGYDPSGTVLTGSALTALTAQVTSVNNVLGDVAADYSGATNKVYNPVTQTYLPGALDAYVYTNGSTSYTVWSDGVVTTTNPSGSSSSTAYQPAPVTLGSQPTLGTFDQFHMSDPDPSYEWASGTLGLSPSGLTTLQLGNGNTMVYGAVLVNGQSGDAIRGVAGSAPGSGPNGGNWFGLGPSGGSNTVYGSPVGNIYDLQNSSALIDTLRGSTGFDVVLGKNSTGVDVNLTSGGQTGLASRDIDAMVGNKAASDTVEVDLSTLNVTNVGGVRESVFEAMFGSTNSTLTLSAPSSTHWIEVTSFAPGAAPPPNAQPLYNPSMLDALYGPGSYKAENSLTGYLFEQVNAKGMPLATPKYVTIYTDGTLATGSLPAAASAMAQAMAQMGASSSAAVHGANFNAAQTALTLAAPVA